MRYVEDVIDLIGDTPLVRLKATTEDTGALVLGKMEYFNPGGSSKDRIASRIIDAAEASGELLPGGTIVEPTSGNTGIGLAMVARARGYRCVFVCPDKVSESKRDTLRAYGAEVVVCPTSVAPEHPDSYYSVSARLAAEIPLAYRPDQYSHPANPASHYEVTGPEIWEQTEGRITHFVAGMGTGGTISGVGRHLKEVSGGRVQVIGADPEGSVYSGGTGRPYLVEGVGEDLWPENYDRDICDEILMVSDAESFDMTRRLAREESLLVGGSSGLAAAAARRVAARCGPGDVIVVFMPDGGRGYLSKIFNDTWMARHGFESLGRTGQSTIAELLDVKAPLPSLVSVRAGQTMGEAARLMREHGVSQMPVVNGEPPVTAGEVVGSVDERGLLAAMLDGTARPDHLVDQHQGPPLPGVGLFESVSSAVARLRDADGLLVFDRGKAVGIVTRQDIVSLWCAGSLGPAGQGTTTSPRPVAMSSVGA